MAANRRRIVFYGDSNTFGYDPAEPYELRFPYLKRWTSMVSLNLKKYYQTVPEGMNGRTIPVPPYEQSYLMKLIGLVKGVGILCTMLGTNDILQTSPPDASKPVRKMEQYIAFLKKHLECSQILMIAPPLVGSETAGDPLLRDYCRESRKMNDAFRTIASGQGVMFADASEWGIDLSTDQVHFSEEGHRTFAEKMTELLMSIRQENGHGEEAASSSAADQDALSEEDEADVYYDYKMELGETLALADEAYENLLYMTDSIDLEGRIPDNLEDAMESLYNAVSILEEAVDEEESGW